MQTSDKEMSYIDFSRTPVVTQAVTANCSPDWSWKHTEGARSGYNLWLIRNGHGRLTSEGREFDLNPGDCFLLKMWCAQHGRHDPKHPLTVPFVLFDYVDDSGNSIAREMPQPPLHYRIRNLDFFAGIIDRCIEAHREQRHDDTRHWLRTALLELRDSRNRPAMSERATEQAIAIETLCQDILRFPGARRSIPELARDSGYSTDHFIRIFRRHKGITPNEYIIRTRLHEADSLLLFSDHSIARIAEILGYPDEFAFSHQFKSRRGLSPRNYRSALLAPASAPS